MLTPHQVTQYKQHGFLPRVPVANPVDAAAIRRQFDALESSEGTEKAQIGLLDRHFDVPFIMELATSPNVLDCVAALIGPDILLLATHFFCKYGSDEENGKFVAWHQDVTYWGLEPPEALTVWYAVDDSDVENGCMRVIPGTHLAGIREHGKAEAKGNLLSINQQVPVTSAEEKPAVDLELCAGEASIHDGLAIHCSLPNRSNRRRCGLTLRYVSTNVKPVRLNSIDKRWNALLVRGEDTFGHFGR